LKATQITDGMIENAKEKNVKIVQNTNFVKDHGKNILKCMVGKNLNL
jgi:type III secretion system FlhB-like substrate exporter